MSDSIPPSDLMVEEPSDIPTDVHTLVVGLRATLDTLSNNLAIAKDQRARTTLILKILVPIGGLLLVVLAGLGVLGFRQLGESGRISAESSRVSAALINQLQSNCQFDHAIATIPLTPTSTSVAEQILAGARIAYYGLGCVANTGPLPAADVRLFPYLPKEFR